MVDVVDVVEVVEVVDVVVVVGRLEVVGGLIEVAVVVGVDVVGGAAGTTAVGTVVLGGWVVEAIDDVIDRGIVVAGAKLVTGVAGSEADGVASVGPGLATVGGGAGGSWSVTGGEVTWRTCWLRLGEDDMMPVNMVATVATTTIVPTPRAMPTRGSPIVRENAERMAPERAGCRLGTSSIEGGLASPPRPARGSPTSSARKTNAGVAVSLAATSGAGGSSILAAGGAAASPIAALVRSTASTPGAADAPMRRFDNDRRTSIACSWPSTDRRSPRFDDQVTWDSRIATTTSPVTRKKMAIPRPPPSRHEAHDLVRRSSSPYELH